MEFIEQARKLKILKEVLVLFPNDKYIKNLLSKTLNSIEIKENFFSVHAHGKLKSFLTTNVIDWGKDERNNFKDKVVNNFIDFIPIELYNQKMYSLTETKWNDRNPLEQVLVDAINLEIKSIYVKHKQEIHLI